MARTVRRVKRKDVEYYSRHACDEDRMECMAMMGMTPREAVLHSLKNSERSYSVLDDDKLVCIFGACRHSALSHSASIWMLATSRIKKYPMISARAILDSLSMVTFGYSKVDNHVDARNIKMVNLLKMAGFKVEDPAPFGVLGRPFHYFWKEMPCA